MKVFAKKKSEIRNKESNFEVISLKYFNESVGNNIVSGFNSGSGYKWLYKKLSLMLFIGLVCIILLKIV